MSKQDSDSGLTSLLISAAAGGLIGAAAALLVAPKEGSKLRKDFGKSYKSFCENAKDFHENFMEKGHDAYETASDYADNIKELAEKIVDWTSASNKNLAIGALGASLLGAGAAFFYATQAGKDIRDNFSCKVKKKNSESYAEWLSIIKNIAETVYPQKNQHEDEDDEETHKGSPYLQDLYSLAKAGANLWRHTKTRS